MAPSLPLQPDRPGQALVRAAAAQAGGRAKHEGAGCGAGENIPGPIPLLPPPAKQEAGYGEPASSQRSPRSTGGAEWASLRLRQDRLLKAGQKYDIVESAHPLKCAKERGRMPNLATAGELDELRIQLLGTFCVWVGSRAITSEQWRLRKAKGLVKLLALAPAHCLHREQAMDLLWPDSEPDSAANSLHQALHAARRTLDPADANSRRYLSLQNEILCLCPESPLWVDVEAFESAANEARRSRDVAVYRAAVDLYRGDLLPEDRYEEWAVHRRESLRQTYIDLLFELAKLAELHEDHALALGTLEQVLKKDPAHEEAHAGLMRLYALTGRRQQALRQYLALQETLQHELGVEPDPQSLRLYQDILARSEEHTSELQSR